MSCKPKYFYHKKDQERKKKKKNETKTTKNTIARYTSKTETIILLQEKRNEYIHNVYYIRVGQKDTKYHTVSFNSQYICLSKMRQARDTSVQLHSAPEMALH